MKKASVLIGIAIGICSLIGIAIGVNEHFATAEDLRTVAMRLDQKIRLDKCDWMQKRIWQLEDRYSGKCMPPSVKEEYRRLKSEYGRDCKNFKYK